MGDNVIQFRKAKPDLVWAVRDRIAEIVRDASNWLSVSELECISGELHEAGHILDEIAVERVVDGEPYAGGAP